MVDEIRMEFHTEDRELKITRGNREVAFVLDFVEEEGCLTKVLDGSERYETTMLFLRNALDAMRGLL